MTVKMADARVKAAKLRILAANQRAMAESYTRQAMQTEAEADLIIAKAEEDERGAQ